MDDENYLEDEESEFNLHEDEEGEEEMEDEPTSAEFDLGEEGDVEYGEEETFAEEEEEEAEEEEAEEEPHEEEEYPEEETFEEAKEPEEEVETHVAAELSMGREGIKSPQEVPLQISIEAGRIRMTVQKLMELQPGNILDLNVRPEEGVELVVGGKRVAKGELLQVGDVLGVRILELG